MTDSEVKLLLENALYGLEDMAGAMGWFYDEGFGWERRSDPTTYTRIGVAFSSGLDGKRADGKLFMMIEAQERDL